MKQKPVKGGWVQTEFPTHSVTTKPKPRDVLQEMRDEHRQAQNTALHEKLVKNPRIQNLAKETGLTGDELFAIADIFKGDEYGDAIQGIASEVASGTSFSDAVTRWKNIVKPDQEFRNNK